MIHRRLWLIVPVIVAAGALAYLLLSVLTGAQPYQGTDLDGVAPDFRLMDQNGSIVALSDFRGRVVVLTFMDSVCELTCPLTAADFREAYRQLDEDEASQVVFLGVNVNADAPGVDAVLAATREWRLEEIPSWRFLTGSRADLAPVWADYGIAVMPPMDGHDLIHTPGVFIIDTMGQKRWYLSTSFSREGDGSRVPALEKLLLRYIRQVLRS